MWRIYDLGWRSNGEMRGVSMTCAGGNRRSFCVFNVHGVKQTGRRGRQYNIRLMGYVLHRSALESATLE